MRFRLTPFLLLARGGCISVSRPAANSATLQSAASAWAAAAVARDADGMARYFAENAFVMYPQPQPTVGREANHRAWRSVFGQQGVEHPVTTDSVWVAQSDDLGYTRPLAVDSSRDNIRRAVSRRLAADGR